MGALEFSDINNITSLFFDTLEELISLYQVTLWVFNTLAELDITIYSLAIISSLNDYEAYNILYRWGIRDFRQYIAVWWYYLMDNQYKGITNQYLHNVYITKLTPVKTHITLHDLIFAKFLFNISLFIAFLTNIIFFSKLNFYRNQINYYNSLAKYNSIVESEKEFGSLDDITYFLMLFIVMFSWFFLGTVFIQVLGFRSFSWVFHSVLFLIIIILLIPISLFCDLGLSFVIYIRGAASGTKFSIEFLFDFIGVSVIIARFLIQNIRFVLIFIAFFELFEWIYVSENFEFFNKLFLTFFSGKTIISLISIQTLYVFILKTILLIIGYAYYAVHLILLIFMQVSVYGLITFWLFFFLYTSFFLTKYEKHFMFKRLLN